MGVTDLITLYALIIAIIALINERSRGLILLKFIKADYIILIAIFIALNYLVFFGYFIKWGLYFHPLMIEKFPEPKDWAYVVTVVTVIYLVIKLIIPSIPGANTSRLIEYYTNLLFNNEHLDIIVLFDRYHKQDLLQYLNDQNDDTEKIKQAVAVYYNIITRDDFITKTANARPYFFTDIISTFKKKNFDNEEIVYTYVSTLLKEKNQFLFREIRNNQNYETPSYHYILPEENKILRAFLLDLRVAQQTLVWRPFGEVAISELAEEAKKKGGSQFNQSYEDKDFLWTTRVFNSIWFFDIMVRKGISEKSNDHFWLYYYRNFTRGALDALYIEDVNEIDLTAEFPTYNHRLLYEIVSNLRDWVLYCGDIGSSSQQLYSITCLGTCIFYIAVSEKLTRKFKNYIIGMFIEIYFAVFDAEQLKKEFIKVALNPPFRDNNSQYVAAITDAWEKFDKVPYERYDEGILEINTFEAEIISVLRSGLYD